jgi:hypothetical protein
MVLELTKAQKQSTNTGLHLDVKEHELNKKKVLVFSWQKAVESRIRAQRHFFSRENAKTLRFFSLHRKSLGYKPPRRAITTEYNRLVHIPGGWNDHTKAGGARASPKCCFSPDPDAQLGDRGPVSVEYASVALLPDHPGC